MQLLEQKFQIDKEYFKEPLPKWMGIAWDAFRLIENNASSVIFQLLHDDDPSSAEFINFCMKVSRPDVSIN